MKKIIPLVSIFALLFIPILVAAQYDPFATTQTFATNISNVGGVITIIKKVATWFLTIVVAVAVIFFVYAGFLYLTSGGDDDKIKSAKNYLLYGIIGVAVALLASGLVSVAMYLANNTQGL